MISTVLQNWKDSLKLFQPATLTLYLLGCLNVFVQSLRLVVTYFSWVIAPLIVLHIWGPHSLDGVFHSFGMRLTDLLQIILLYGFIMSVRPSQEPKDLNYYRTYAPWIWGPALLYLAAFSFMLPLVALALLFFFDGTNSLDGIWLAFKRIVKAIGYFFPAFLIIASIIVTINLIITAGAHWLGSYIPGIGVIIISLLHLLNYATLTVWYIRIKHNHFSLVFE